MTPTYFYEVYCEISAVMPSEITYEAATFLMRLQIIHSSHMVTKKHDITILYHSFNPVLYSEQGLVFVVTKNL